MSPGKKPKVVTFTFGHPAGKRVLAPAAPKRGGLAVPCWVHVGAWADREKLTDRYPETPSDDDAAGIAAVEKFYQTDGLELIEPIFEDEPESDRRFGYHCDLTLEQVEDSFIKDGFEVHRLE